MSWLPKLALTVALLIWAYACIDIIRFIYRDTIDDIRWYRSQNRCRYCQARLDPEYEELEVDLVRRHIDGRDDA